LKYFLALGLLVAIPANAQAPVEPVEITPFFGYLLGGTPFHQGIPGYWIPSLHIADHTTFGLRAGYNVTASLEPEIQWSRTETSRTGNPPEPLTIDFFLAGLTYNFSAARLRPYVSAGIGAGLFDGLNGPFQHTLFTTSLALGAKYFFTPNVGLRLEARGYASKPDSIVRISCGCPNSWIFDGDFTGGLAIAF
jgi:hypothetical protein